MLKFVLKRKVDSIAATARKLITTQGCKCTVAVYGAYDVDARLLVVVMQVPTDAEREKLKTRPGLLQNLKDLPAKEGYPADACNDVVLEIQSQETVDRENEGNWSYRYG